MPTRYRVNPAATAIMAIADIAAFIIGLWIAMYILDANRANDLVDFIHDLARWLAGWSHDLFSVRPDWWQVLLNYGIAALAYLLIGHMIARTVKRF